MERKHPVFSLCGLNCCLCPRYNTEGKSKCPGCGGKDFNLKHPSCAVINCNKKKDNVEFCFQCKSYPCKKYTKENNEDSFITYKNVMKDFNDCEKYINKYIDKLNKKTLILERLLKEHNNGRLKNFYCIAVNLLEIQDLENVIKSVEDLSISKEDKIKLIVDLLNDVASRNNISLKLRK